MLVQAGAGECDDLSNRERGEEGEKETGDDSISTGSSAQNRHQGIQYKAGDGSIPTSSSAQNRHQGIQLKSGDDSIPAFCSAQRYSTVQGGR